MPAPKALVPLAQGVEELEAVTIIDVLRRAGVEVVTASLDRGMVKGSRGTVLIADTTLDDALKGSYDAVVLPGGQPGTHNLKIDQRVLSLLKKQAAAGRLSAAICAAPGVLAEAGLLKGKKATAFPGTDLKDAALSELDIVEDGNVITAKSVGVAMDFALILVEKLCGKDKRIEVESKMYRG